MTTDLRVMIVDDEAPAREGLRLRLKKESGVVVIGEYSSAMQALAAIKADVPDVLFLDIEMPGLDGFALLARAESIALPVIIFVTAHGHHAVRAFDARALDYLLKPVEQERLQEALARAREHLEGIKKGEMADRMRDLLRRLDRDSPNDTPTSPRTAVRIPLRTDGTIHFIESAEIQWVDAAGDAVRIQTGAASHVLQKSMGQMLAMLDDRHFVRIHRSTIVNLDHVKELQPYFHGEYVVVMKSGATLKLSRSYRAEVARLLGLDS